MRPAAAIIDAVRLSLSRAGLADRARIHYGGQGRGGVHRLWISGNVLGVERSVCMTFPAAFDGDTAHLARFVLQTVDQVVLMRLADGFRP